MNYQSDCTAWSVGCLPVQLLWAYQTEPSDKGEEHFTRLLEHVREFGGDRRLSALQVHYRWEWEGPSGTCMQL